MASSEGKRWVIAPRGRASGSPAASDEPPGVRAGRTDRDLLREHGADRELAAFAAGHAQAGREAEHRVAAEHLGDRDAGRLRGRAGRRAGRALRPRRGGRRGRARRASRPGPARASRRPPRARAAASAGTARRPRCLRRRGGRGTRAGRRRRTARGRRADARAEAAPRVCRRQRRIVPPRRGGAHAGSVAAAFSASRCARPAAMTSLKDRKRKIQTTDARPIPNVSAAIAICWPTE